MKKLVGAIILLLVVLGGGYVLLVTLYSPEAQRAELEARLSQAFGRPAHVGPMRLTFRGGLGVEATDVKIERDPSFGEGSFVEVDRVFADLGVWDYLVRRRSAIEHLELERPRIALVKREDGVWNWAALGGRPATAGAAPVEMVGPLLAAIRLDAPLPTDPARITPSRITAIDAQVTITNRTISPPTETSYRGLALDTAVEPADRAYRLQGSVTGDSGAAGGEPLATELKFDLVLTPPGDVPVWQARGSVPSGRLATRNVRVDSIVTQLALDPGQALRFEPLSIGLYGGTLDGSFALDLSTPNNRFSTGGTVRNVALGDALAPRPDLAGGLQGNASGTFQASGELGDFSSTLVSLAGDGHIVIDGAQLTSMNLLAEITKQSGLQEISFDEQGTRAERIEADLKLEGGKIGFSKALVSRINGYADLRGDSGWVDLKSPASIRFDGAATLLPPLFDKVRQANPAAGAIIAMFNARSNPAIPLTVSGSLTKPTVSVRWTAAMGLPF